MAAKGIVIQITGDGASAARALEMVDQHLRQTATASKESASEIGEAMETIKRRMEMVGLNFALYEIIAKMKELITSTLEFGEVIQRASEKTGLAVETLSVLHYAAATTGGDFDGMTSAVAKMDKTIGQAAQGNKTAGAFLKSLGLNAKELSERSDGAEVAFKKFTATLASTENPIKRVALATGLLGKAGAEQIPTLIDVGQHWDEFKQKASDAGVLLNDQTAAALEATNKKIKEMQQNVLGGAVAFTEGLTPAIGGMMNVIGGGKSQLDMLTTWGHEIGKVIAFVGEVSYTAAAAVEALFAASAGGKFTESGREQIEATHELWAKANAMHGIAFGDDHPGMTPNAGKIVNGINVKEDQKPNPKPTDWTMPDLGGKTKTAKSTEGVASAATALAEAKTAAEMQALKSADALKLAQLEATHKLLEISDQKYFAEKLRLQKDEIDLEVAAAQKRIAELQALEAKQHRDKKLVRDKSGNSAEELKSQRDIVTLQQQIVGLKERSKALDVGEGAAAQERADALHLANLRAAAQMEEQTNKGISARLALMQAEQQDALQKTTAAGGDVAGLKALQAQEQQLLRIGEIERQIRETEAAGNLAVAAQRDREEKDPTQRKAATKEINALNQQLAATLKDLVAQYDALAATLGGEFIEKARALHAELDKLNTPDNKSNAKFAETLGSGIESMAQKMASATGRGRESFHAMAMSIEQDIAQLAIKLAFQKWLTPMLTKWAGGGVGAATSAALPGFAQGGDPTGPSIVGEQGPELFFPKGPGTIVPNNALQNLSKSGGGSMPNVTMNITNASSQPVTARQTGTSFDADMKAFVIHTILEDHASGGPISAAAQGG